MLNIELTVQELYYLRRAVDVYTNDLREYIKENGNSALDPTIFDGILDKIENMIDKEKTEINPNPGSTLPNYFLC